MMNFTTQTQFPPFRIPKLKGAEEYATNLKGLNDYYG